MGSQSVTAQSLTEIFEDVFPYYINAGMTYEQFWEDDCTLVIFYKKAFEQRREYDSTYAWLQGKYIYDALAMVSPMFNSLKPRKPNPYHEHPFAITEHMKDEQELDKTRKFAEQFREMAQRRNKYLAEHKDG